MIRSYFFPRSMLRKSSIITLTPRSCRCCASSGLISTASIEKSPYFCSVLIMLPLPAPGSSTSIPPPQRENVEKSLDRRDRCRVEVVRASFGSSICRTHCLPPYNSLAQRCLLHVGAFVSLGLEGQFQCFPCVSASLCQPVAFRLPPFSLSSM